MLDVRQHGRHLLHCAWSADVTTDPISSDIGCGPSLVPPLLKVLQTQDFNVVTVVAEPTLEFPPECLPVTFGDLLHASVDVVEGLVEHKFQTAF